MNEHLQTAPSVTVSICRSEGATAMQFWLIGEDAKAAAYRRRAISVDSESRIVNSKDLKHALFKLKHTRSVNIRSDVPLPDGFLQPVLSLPPIDFAADYFTMQSEVFVSCRFREALAQPDDVVQYWPVDIVRASVEAQQQDYKFFRILASQEALDWERSVYEKSDSYNRRTGEKFVSVRFVERFVSRADLVPRTEIFRSAESSVFVLATDSLAERVMRAGCEGVSFGKPETIGMSGREPQRTRTADGIEISEP